MNESQNDHPVPENANMDISSDNLEPVELLADEFIHRQRAGEKPTIDEYCERHPELAEEIRETFPALMVMEQIAPATGDLDASNRSFTSPDAKPIESIGDYRVLREIGRGGMGVVYEAEQESLGRRVALKLLPRHIAKDQRALLRFQQEARAAARMHHTNIVPVFEVGHDNEYSYYAMQLIKGQGLDHVIDDLRDIRSQHVEANKQDRRHAHDNGDRTVDRGIANSLMVGQFDLERLQDGDHGPNASPPSVTDDPAMIETIVQAGGSTDSASLPGDGEISTAQSNRRAYFRSVAEIGWQAANALSYAHSRGITHRDIKPSNLILDTAGVVWITDFGLARTGDSSMTQTGDILGTIRYMSPERFKGQCDNRADVYSLGLTLYELLVLKPAFESPDRLQLIDMVTKTEVAAPRSVDARVPRDLETIVLKAADKDPKRRYQSADELAGDLQRFVNDEPIRARRASAMERVTRWSRRNPGLAIALSVAAVALIAVSIVSGIAARQQTTAALEQARLNKELSEANSEQRNLNAVLRKKTDQQQATNEALAETNRTNEELIRDLRRSQSRVYAKQSEFVAQQGDLAEAMLWRAAGYRLTESTDTQFRSELLAKLRTSAQEMPELVSEQPVRSFIGSPMSAAFVAWRTSRPQDPRTPSTNPGLRADTQFGRIAHMADGTRRVVPFGVHQPSDQTTGQSVTGFRCYDVRSGRWTGEPIWCEGTPIAYDFCPAKGWLATWSFQFSAVDAEAADGLESPPRTSPPIQATKHLVVHRITDGSVVFHRSEDHVEPARDPSVFTVVNALGTRGVRFSPDGELLKTYVMTASGGLTVEEISLPEGEVQSTLDYKTEINGPVYSPIRISTNGNRLFKVAPTGGRFRRTLQLNSLRCFDMSTGSQLGKPVSMDGANALVLPGNAARVAVVRRDGSHRYVVIVDMETGEQVGESLELDIPSSMRLRLVNASDDGARLAVAYLPTKNSSDSRMWLMRTLSETLGRTPAKADEPSDPVEDEARGYVRVFDLTTRQALTPPLPTEGTALDVLFSDGGRRLVVRDIRRIRTWQLPGTPFGRFLVPLPRSTEATTFRTSPYDRMAFTATGDGELIIARQTDDTLRLESWDSRTGRFLRARGLPPSPTGYLDFQFSAGGRYLATILPHQRVPMRSGFAALRNRPRRNSSIQIWDVKTGQPIHEPISRTRLNAGGDPETPVTDATFAAIGPNGRWLAAIASRGEARVLRLLEVDTDRTLEFTFERLNPGGREAPIVKAAFTEDGSRVMTLRPRRSGLHLDVLAFDASTNAITPLAQRTISEIGVSGRLPFQVPTFQHPNLFLSPDGRYLAGTDDNLRFVCVGIDSGELVASVEMPARSRNNRGPFLHCAFEPKGRAIFLDAMQDGLVRRLSIPAPWDPSAEAVVERVQRHTGIQFGSDNAVVNTDLNRNRPPRTELVAPTMALRELRALDAFALGETAEPQAIFHEWASQHPTEWMPLLLNVELHLKEGRVDEADHAWKLAAERVDRPTMRAWIRRVYEPSSSSVNRLTTMQAEVTDWLYDKLLATADNDAERANVQFQQAKAHEIRLEFDRAAATIDRAVAISPTASFDMHHYRAHLMERLNRWADALTSRQDALKALGEGAVEGAILGARLNVASFRVICSHLFAGDEEAALEAWADSVAMNPKVVALDGGSGDGRVHLYNRERIAKTRLVIGGVNDKGFKLAVALANENFEDDDAMSLASSYWFAQTRGIATYRTATTDDALSQAVEELNEAVRLFKAAQAASHKRGISLCRFFSAMAHARLGDTEAAERDFLDGLDHQYSLRDQIRASTTATWNDWQLAEVVRREAQTMLGITPDTVDLPIPQDTSEWPVLIEDNFDTGLSDRWRRITRNWKVVDGAACGTLEPTRAAEGRAYCRMDYELPNLLSTFQVEYEVETSEPMLAACFLRLKSSQQPIGHRVALCSFSDAWLTQQGLPGTGVSLLTSDDFGVWFNQTVPEVQIEPGRRYHVRIIRQPRRVTVFLDEKQLISQRVRDIDTRFIRFFGSGKDGAKMTVDHFRLTIPPTNERPK